MPTNMVNMCALVYRGHVEYDTNNDVMSKKVNTAASWSHIGSLEHILEPVYTRHKSIGIRLVIHLHDLHCKLLFQSKIV